MIESQWEKIIASIRDELICCPFCGEETFAETEPNAQCMECGKSIDVSNQIIIGSRNIILTKGTKIYIDNDNTPDCEVVVHPKDPARLLLKNISETKWTAETPSGKLKEVEPGNMMPINPGIKVSFYSTYKGEIVKK
jgi:hypothetical protein